MLEYFKFFYISHNYGIGYIMTNIVFVAACMVLLGDFNWKKKGTLVRFICQFLICWLWTVLFDTVYYAITKGVGAGNMDRIMMAVFILFYCAAFSKLSWTTRILRTVVFYTCYMTMLPVSEPIGEALQNVNADYFVWSQHLTWIIVVVMTMVVAWFLTYFSTEKLILVQKVPALLVVIMSCLILLVETVGIVRNVPESFKSYMVLIGGAGFLLEILCYYLFYRIGKEYDRNTELMAISQKENLDQELFQSTRAVYEEMHEIRHEMKNHLAYIHILFEKGENERLEEYLKEVSRETENLFSFVECGNDVINAVMNHIMTQAKAENITLEPQLIVPPVLPYPETELCSLLSNLVENALEAAGKSGEKNPVVTVGIRPQQDYLFIHVTNPVNPQISNRRHLKLQTTKENVKVHGYGTKIIQNIAIKNQGSVRYDIEDGRFVADVMLYLGEDSYGETKAGNL